VVIGDGSSSKLAKADESKRKPKRLVRGYSESNILDRNFKRRVTRSQSIVNFALMTQVMNTDEPQCYVEGSRKNEWNQAMQVEFNALVRNDAWDLVSLPKGKDVISSKWLYKTKYKSNVMHKRERIDYT
jgi:hypothetical protein